VLVASGEARMRRAIRKPARRSSAGCFFGEIEKPEKQKEGRKRRGVPLALPLHTQHYAAAALAIELRSHDQDAKKCAEDSPAGRRATCACVHESYSSWLQVAGRCGMGTTRSVSAKLAIARCGYLCTLIRVGIHTALPYNSPMYTVIETEVFERYAADIWRDDEREAFIIGWPTIRFLDTSFLAAAGCAKFDGRAPVWVSAVAPESSITTCSTMDVSGY